jgi:hypothetical protein
LGIVLLFTAQQHGAHEHRKNDHAEHACFSFHKNLLLILNDDTMVPGICQTLPFDPEEPFKKVSNPIPDTPEEAGVAEFVYRFCGLGDFFGGKILALQVFFNLVFQLGKAVADVHHHGVDGPPAQVPGRLKPPAPGDKLAAVIEDDGAHLAEAFHALRQGRDVAHFFADPLFYNDVIQGDLHRNTSPLNYIVF